MVSLHRIPRVCINDQFICMHTYFHTFLPTFLILLETLQLTHEELSREHDTLLDSISKKMILEQPKFLNQRNVCTCKLYAR